MFPKDGLSGRYIQVIVSIQDNKGKQIFSVDPWNNCPSEIVSEEGRFCNDCEFWGRRVEGIDWFEFSLCLFEE
jgi:hypothetical protein